MEFMEIDNLPEKVKRAKEAVADLEEPLKTEAFKKILDKLLEPDVQQQMPVMHQQQQGIMPVAGKPKKNSTGKKNKINTTLNSSNAKLKEEADKRKRELAEKINRTEHSEIHDLPKTLAKALYVIKIMQEKKVDVVMSNTFGFGGHNASIIFKRF